MPTQARHEAPILFAGDIFFLVISLWATLFVRYGTPPSLAAFIQHAIPFSFLFLLSTLVFFIAGLYEKHTLPFKSRLPEAIFYTQIANIIVAAVFFFLVPYFGIQPKTNLAIYLVLSTLCVSLWRLSVFPLFSAPTPVPAVLVGEGPEAEEIVREVNGNPRYGIRIIEIRPLRGSTLIPDDTLCLGTAALYEEIFDRVALAFLDERWFLEERARTQTALYGFLKRAMDIVISSVALILLLPLILLIVAILMIGQGGSAFIFQKRVGQHDRPIRIVKFRSMLFDDEGNPERQKSNRVTCFGAFLRRTQIDEIPQFWNVLKGDLSLIGPRPEMPALVAEYEKRIPFYRARHLLPPGISGWAQIKHASPPKFSVDVERTRQKLSYDLYYLKHRSLLLDLSIALQTLKLVLARAGR